MSNNDLLTTQTLALEEGLDASGETVVKAKTSKDKASKASVLALTRCIDIADGAMFDLMAKEQGFQQGEPLLVHRCEARGVQGMALKKDGTAVSDVSNILMFDVTRTSVEAAGLLVKTVVCFHPVKDALKLCDSSIARKQLQSLLAAATETDPVIAELSRRYARNLLNGRWLWRNRELGKRIEVTITAPGLSEMQVNGALDFASEYTPEERAVATWIARVLTGTEPGSIAVEGRVIFDCPGSFEVFPSQLMVTAKEKNLGRMQYTLFSTQKTPEGAQGFAGIRDAKIGNALRTIDTWYPRFAEIGVPIAVEPTGGSLTFNEFFRPKQAVNAFGFFTDTALQSGYVDRSYIGDAGATEKLLYLWANIIRGGVFGSK